MQITYGYQLHECVYYIMYGIPMDTGIMTYIHIV